MTDPLDDFTLGSFAYRGVTHDVYRSGEGPAVIVIAEIPGITPEVADFARRVRDLGCTVRPARAVRRARAEVVRRLRRPRARQGLRLEGVRRLRHPHARRRSSEWLRALARHAHERVRGPGVGAVGMCFTGGFALGMMADETVHRPGAQPAVAAAAAVLEEGQGERCSSPTTTSPP